MLTSKGSLEGIIDIRAGSNLDGGVEEDKTLSWSTFLHIVVVLNIYVDLYVFNYKAPQ